MREKEARSVQKLLHTLYITEPDTVLRRDGEALVAVHANGREDHIPLHLLDRIVCFSGASISPAVIDACVKHDVGFSALSQSGRFCFRLNGPTTGNVLLRKKQYTLPCENRLYLAKRMLHGKLEGQATVLGRFRRNHPSELLRATEEAIRTIAEQLPMAVTNEGLRGLEGQAARLYFDAFGRMILTEDKAFRFEGRNRRPPRDRCNAILRGKSDVDKTMFQTRYIDKGQTFEGYIELDDPKMAEMIAAALPKTVWLGADRYEGFGKCSVVCCEVVEEPAWRREYGFRKQNEVTQELYLLAVSPFTMLNEIGDPCGLSQRDLAEKMGVGSVVVSVCSTSMSEYGSYNRIWKGRNAAVRMYDRGSIFKLCCDRAPDLERLQKIEREGLGIRRAEGFGQVLFLKNELFEGIRHKAAVEGTRDTKQANSAAAVRRARYCWVMARADEVRESGLSPSQLGTLQALCERAIACNGKLDELERFFNRNLNDRGAKHASKFSKIYELVKRVTTTPMENLIGVSCNDNMTERLRLLCLLFDFSRKEGE